MLAAFFPSRPHARTDVSDGTHSLSLFKLVVHIWYSLMIQTPFLSYPAYFVLG